MLLSRHAAETRRGAGFGPANHRFDRLQFVRIDVAGLLYLDECLDVRLDLVGLPFAEQFECAAILRDKIRVANRRLIEDRDVAAGLIGDVNIVALIAKPDQRAAHADNIVIRVRAEDDDALGETLQRRA